MFYHNNENNHCDKCAQHSALKSQERNDRGRMDSLFIQLS